MHILFLSDNFPPEVNAPASRTFEHCREWVKLGHKVTVITCAPNFPKGKVYDGYKNKIWQSEFIDGIRVIRVWSYITANEGFVKRILDYQSFMVSATIAAIFVRKPDLVVATSPQFFTACCGVVVSGLKRIPFVFELRDIWPESVKAVGAMGDSKLIRLLERLELFLYRKADLIISVTNSFKKTLISRGVDGSKIQVVTNGVDVSRYTPREKDAELLKEYKLEGKFVAGYIGTHGMAHALETILEAAAKLRQREDGQDIRFILLGHGARKKALQKKAEEMMLDNVIFIDSVPKDEVVRYWSILDFSVIHLKNTPLFTTVIPSKLFECMGMGLPVLHGVAGESAEIVLKENAGVVFEPENSDDLIEKLLELKNNPEKYRALQKSCLLGAVNYDRAALAKKMLNALQGVMNK
jgi:glycosyltransferase involved in cell wall biosynthesis